MAKELQLRGGTTDEHSTFTGAVREVTVDTDKDTLVVHDGVTAGGFPLIRNGGAEKVGIGTNAPEALLHIDSPTNPSTIAVNGNANEFAITGDQTVGMNILGSNVSLGRVLFGDMDDSSMGGLTYDHNTDVMHVGAGNVYNSCTVTQYGLAFHGDTAAANSLNDYEEGTWTPELKSGGNVITVPIEAIYTKIGNIVHLTFLIENQDATGDIGTGISITGVPFVCATRTMGSTVNFYGGLKVNKGRIAASLSGSTISIYHQPDDGDYEGVSFTTIGNSAYFRFSITYKTNA